MHYLEFKHIVILTGAGISAESGLGTFRDNSGLWTQYDIEDVATPQGFIRNPGLVHDFYNRRRSDLKVAKPNEAHLALAHLEKELEGSPTAYTLITQNVDDLHKRAGSKKLIAMHGELTQSKCNYCDFKRECQHDLSIEDRCLNCKESSGLRPDIVWFGELPYGMDQIYEALATCDLFVSIGTSGEVYPAAEFVKEAKHNSAFTIELNLEKTANQGLFDDAFYGPATKIVPKWVDKFLYR